MCRPADPSDVTGRRPPGARRSMRQTRRWLQSRRETLFPFSSSISSSSSSSVVAVVSFFLFCFPLHFFLFDYFFVCFFLFCFILFPIELSTAPMSRSGRTRCQSSCSNCCFPPWTSNSPPTGPADLTCPATKTSKNESNPSSIAGRPSTLPFRLPAPLPAPLPAFQSFFFFKLYRK